MNFDKSDNKHNVSNQKISIPPLSLPKGGGAMNSIGETFQPDAFSGTGSYSIPIPVTPARGFEPQLSIDYNSGAGNSPFGIGFSLSLPNISRRTEKGIPEYTDKDVFVLEGTELTPKLREVNGKLEKDTRTELIDETTYVICPYLPRIEGAFSLIEQWTNEQTRQSYWKIVTGDNTTHIYGQTTNAVISDPGDASRIFEWLIERSTDTKGNKIIYTYKEENTDNVPNVIYEQGHTYNNRYIQRIQYGNYIDTDHKEQFAFEVVFDYGEFVLPTADSPVLTSGKSWEYRPDPFSSYRSGFEIRTCRLCRNILILHNVEAETGASCLVKSVSLNYQQPGSYGDIDMTGPSIMQSVILTGYRRNGTKTTDTYEVQHMPPLEFSFSAFNPPANPGFKNLEVNTHNLPGYPDHSYFQPVDLNGEGIAGFLYADGNSVLYMEPEGAGTYSAPVSLTRFPIDKNFLNGQSSFVDLESDGQLELVVRDASRTGFYPKQGDGTWGVYQPFTSYPVNYQAPAMEMADLDSNGKTDLLQVRENNILIYPSLGKAGYAPVKSVLKEVDFPLLKQGSKKEYTGFLDIFGDGLSHRVKITNGNVECWPALGYGKFGNKITLTNAPRFGEDFHIDRLFFADIDGSGTMDMVYAYRDRVELFLNQSGNSFSDPITVNLPAPYTNIDQITFADISGNGTTCLVYTKIAPVPRQYYYEFTGQTVRDGQSRQSLKPYLLNEINNNLGAITQIQYCSSTKFYLEDKKAGRLYITKLHFPVQVVEKIVTIDQISGTRFVNRFKYHDGFYDPVEREFRGFGYVEAWDTETYAEYEQSAIRQDKALATLDEKLYVPPVYTRSWYHTGVFLNNDVITRYYKNEYFQGDSNAYDFPDSLFQADIYNTGPETLRQAYVALKGTVIRQEVYALDNGENQANPYTVEESNVEVKLLQEKGEQQCAVFMINPRQTISYHYERDPDDPRVQQGFTLAVDAFGNVTQACTVFLPRRPGPSVHPEQQTLKGTVSLTAFINHTENFRLIGIPYENEEFELIGLDLEGENYFSFDTITTQINTALQSRIPYGAPPTQSTLQARQLTWARTSFWNQDQSEALPFGQISSRALPHHHEEAVFTEDFIHDIFGNKVTDETIRDKGGYHYDEDTGYWWNRGLTQKYLTVPANYYLPVETLNSFVDQSSSLFTRTTVSYDPYFLAVICQAQYIDANNENVVTAEIDYTTLQPRQLVDINNNVSQALFDPLGQVIATTLFGTQNNQSAVGLRLYPYDNEPAQYVPPGNASFDQVITNPQDYLQGAASYFYYNLNAWQDNQQPVSSIHLINNHYFQTEQDPAPEFSCQILIGYSDGLGRVIESKQKTETENRETWVVSGRTVYNNKGEPCEHYLPYFNAIPQYEPQQQIAEQQGVPPPTIIHYDPLLRIIRQDTPKGFFSKVEFTPWEEKHFDDNDTVIDSPYYIDFMNHYPPEPTQQQKDDKDALDKAALFYNTPEIKIVDNTGGVFLDIQMKTPDEELISYYETDILGRILKSIDPRLYNANIDQNTDDYNFKYQYAMGDKDPLLVDSIDAGTEKHLSNIYDNQLWSLSARHYCQVISYDNLQRKTALHVKKIEDDNPITSYADFNLVEVFTYGDTQPDAADNNLRGALYQLKDISGIVINSQYGMQGEALETSRQMAKEYKEPINWNDPVDLEDEIYTGQFTYNAVGHLLTETTPDGSVTTNTYNQAGQLNTVSVNFKDNTQQQVVNNIEYDAKGQRTLIAYGNGIETTYRYEETTLNLTAINSKKASDSATVQDIEYVYDPVGNITRTRDNTYTTVFNNNQQVEPLSDYTYDALYRLIKATGRQHPGINADTYKNNATDNDFKQCKYNALPSVNDADKLENYQETYEYDDSGNLINKQHTAASASWKKETPVEDNTNRLKDLEYDASGNLKKLDINSTVDLTFNCCENLVKAGIIKRPDEPDDCDYYVYDSNEQRTRKVSERMAHGGAVTQIEEKIYLGNYEIKRNKSVDEKNVDQTTPFERQTLRIVDDKTCVAIIHYITIDTQNPEKQNTRQYRFQMDNNLGSVSLEMDKEARLISYEEYFPYGGTAIIAGTNQAEVNQKEYRYSGKERDDSTGLYYYGARYYAPWLGRWLNPDPAGIVDGMNLYAFVGGNPVTHVDVGGMGKTSSKYFEVRGGKIVGKKSSRPTNQNSLRAQKKIAARLTSSKRLSPQQQQFVQEVSTGKKANLKRLGADICHVVSAETMKNIIAQSMAQRGASHPKKRVKRLSAAVESNISSDEESDIKEARKKLKIVMDPATSDSVAMQNGDSILERCNRCSRNLRPDNCRPNRGIGSKKDPWLFKSTSPSNPDVFHEESRSAGISRKWNRAACSVRLPLDAPISGIAGTKSSSISSNPKSAFGKLSGRKRKL